MAASLLIAVSDVPTEVRLGVPAAERARAQRVTVSVRLARPASLPFAPDARIGRTVDYDDLIGFIRDGLPALGPFVLVEAIAEAVAAHALALAGDGAHVEVRVAKPSVLEPPAEVSVTLTRRAP